MLRQLAGPEARLRPDQAAAIEAVGGRTPADAVVQRSFGKSASYFIATRPVRDAGAGPTLVVSPLLALMRDQVAAVDRMGVRSATINSTNLDAWTEIEASQATHDLQHLDHTSTAGCEPADPDGDRRQERTGDHRATETARATAAAAGASNSAGSSTTS